MRIPRVHDLTLEYCRLFDLPLRPFVMGNPKGLVYLGGERMTIEEANAQPSRLPFELADHERGRTADELWESAIGDLRAMVEHDGQAAWDEIVKRYDQFSLYEFLREKRWSEGAIEYYAVMNFLEADMHNAVVEILREDIGKAYVDMQEIAGGMDRLPNAFFADLQHEIRLGAEVFAIDQEPGAVTVHYKTEAGRYRARRRLRDLHRAVLRPADDRDGPALLARQAAGDPPAQLPRLDQDPVPGPGPDLGEGRRHPRRRHRHRPAGPPSQLPDARPDHRTGRAAGLLHLGPGRAPVGRDGRGDAARGGARRRGADPPRGSARSTRSVPRTPGTATAGRVARSPCSRPSSRPSSRPPSSSPRAGSYFAGEHCSLYHAWIQGALESGIRAARQIHEAAGVAEGTGIPSA